MLSRTFLLPETIGRFSGIVQGRKPDEGTIRTRSLDVSERQGNPTSFRNPLAVPSSPSMESPEKEWDRTFAICWSVRVSIPWFGRRARVRGWMRRWSSLRFEEHDFGILVAFSFAIARRRVRSTMYSREGSSKNTLDLRHPFLSRVPVRIQDVWSPSIHRMRFEILTIPKQNEKVVHELDLRARTSYSHAAMFSGYKQGFLTFLPGFSSSNPCFILIDFERNPDVLSVPHPKVPLRVESGLLRNRRGEIREAHERIRAFGFVQHVPPSSFRVETRPRKMERKPMDVIMHRRLESITCLVSFIALGSEGENGTRRNVVAKGRGKARRARVGMTKNAGLGWTILGAPRTDGRKRMRYETTHRFVPREGRCFERNVPRASFLPRPILLSHVSRSSHARIRMPSGTPLSPTPGDSKAKTPFLNRLVLSFRSPKLVRVQGWIQPRRCFLYYVP